MGFNKILNKFLNVNSNNLICTTSTNEIVTVQLLLGPAATSCLCYKTIFVPSHPHFDPDHTLFDM